MEKRWYVLGLALAFLALLTVVSAQANPLGRSAAAQTAALGAEFTYQGQLIQGGQPVSDTCDFEFSLYADAGGQELVGGPLAVEEVDVGAGLFTVRLDFGLEALAGEARWLGIRVQCSGDAEYADLGIQSLTATPYALYALGAPWDGLTNVPPGFADGVDDVSVVVSGTAVYAGVGITQAVGSGSITLSLASAYRLPQSCANGQIAEWDGAIWACGDDDVGAGGGEGDISAVHAGAGLLGGGESGAVTLTVAFSGTGQALTVARTDHDHDQSYAPLAHTHPGEDITSAVATATLALSATQAPWRGITGMPPGFADGVDDDTTYSAGLGLVLSDTQFSVDFGVVALLTHTHAYSSPDVFEYFQEHITITTTGATDWEIFSLEGETYLALVSYVNGSNYHLDSNIYRWDGTGLVHVQSISTIGALDWEFFTIGAEAYLAVANCEDGVTANLDSKIYRWDGSSFVEFQIIPSNGAYDWEFFTLDGQDYLALANHSNDATYNVNSKIYRWDGSSFVEFQAIPTSGATGWEFFTIDDDAYLAVSNRRNDSSVNISSKIYHWNGSSFVEFQSIPTSSGYDWVFFSVEDRHFLAVANYYNGSTFNVDSRVYRWNGTAFETFQSIRTYGAIDLEFFTIGEQAYLTISNFRSDSSHNVNSRVYRWNGTGFHEIQLVPTHNGRDSAFFTIGSDYYLAVANRYDGSTYTLDSTIYKAKLFSRAGTSYLWGQNGSDIYYDVGNVGIGTTHPQSALQVEGYVQLDTLNAPPPTEDCDQPAELGRMKVDVVNDRLYVCTNAGWTWTALNLAGGQ